MSSWLYGGILVLGTLISSVSQVMLKKAAMKDYDSHLREYLNPWVIGAYVLFLLSTLMSILAYRGLPLSMGAVLEATGYLFVTAFGVLLFGERLNRRKVLALALIIGGIVVSAL